VQSKLVLENFELEICPCSVAAHRSSFCCVVVRDSTRAEGVPIKTDTASRQAIEGAPPFDAALFTRVASGAAGNESVHKAAAAAAAFCDLYDDADWDRVPSVLTEDFVEVRSPIILIMLSELLC